MFVDCTDSRGRRRGQPCKWGPLRNHQSTWRQTEGESTIHDVQYMSVVSLFHGWKRERGRERRKGGGVKEPSRMGRGYRQPPCGPVAGETCPEIQQLVGGGGV